MIFRVFDREWNLGFLILIFSVDVSNEYFWSYQKNFQKFL